MCYDGFVYDFKIDVFRLVYYGVSCMGSRQIVPINNEVEFCCFCHFLFRKRDSVVNHVTNKLIKLIQWEYKVTHDRIETGAYREFNKTC